MLFEAQDDHYESITFERWNNDLTMWLKANAKQIWCKQLQNRRFFVLFWYLKGAVQFILMSVLLLIQIRFDIENRKSGELLHRPIFFKIKVKDINDNAPEFSKEEYGTVIRENHSEGKWSHPTTITAGLCMTVLVLIPS